MFVEKKLAGAALGGVAHRQQSKQAREFPVALKTRADVNESPQQGILHCSTPLFRNNKWNLLERGNYLFTSEILVMVMM